jgi:hypothetical protein
MSTKARRLIEVLDGSLQTSISFRIETVHFGGIDDFEALTIMWDAHCWLQSVRMYPPSAGCT